MAKRQLGFFGSVAFGPDRCGNDEIGSSDSDVRFALPSVPPGRDDVNNGVGAGKVAAIESKDLTGRLCRGYLYLGMAWPSNTCHTLKDRRKGIVSPMRQSFAPRIMRDQRINPVDKNTF